MKTVHRKRSGGDSCSCTTCVYKSESDHPSLKRTIDLGSRIDRLYYGKYIPLRERKLIERLVRTRAVYDDIRAQLVSDSTLSLSTKGDHNPRRKLSIRDLDDTEKSSGAVLELVNMIDRGPIGSKKLDECCSCCSCSSKINIHEHRHRQKRTYKGAEGYIERQKRLKETHHRKKGVRFKTKHIRSDPCTCTFKLIKKHSKAIYKKMHQRPPVPILELQSTTDDERNRAQIGDMARTRCTCDVTNVKQNLKEANTRMKENISEAISKLRESQTLIQEKIELQTKKSIEKLNQAKGKLASKMREINKREWQLGPENELAFQVKKDSISKFKEELRRKQIMKDWECEPECVEEICVPEECFIKIKQKKLNWKNIHHKGMNNNIKTQERKAGEPLRQTNHKTQALKLSKTKIIETERPVLRAQKSQGIQESRESFDKAQNKALKLRVTNNKEKETKVIPVTVTPGKISVENVKASHSAKKAKLENSTLERKSSQRQAVRIGSSFSFNVEFYKDKLGQEIPTVDLQPYAASEQHPGIDYTYKKPKKTKKKHLRHQGSQIKLKKSLKDTQTGGRALKRCFCTLKLKANATKSKIRRPVTKKIMTNETSSLSSPTALTLNDVQTNTNIKRKKGKSLLEEPYDCESESYYECEPGVCIPGDCDPYRCIKLINIREAKQRNSSTQARKTKSISSFTSKSYKPSKAKKVQSKVHRAKAFKPLIEKQRIRQANAIRNSRRQAVRIGSTFSFNIEFYKGGPYYEQPARPSSPQSKTKKLKLKSKQEAHVKVKDRGYQENLGNKHRSTPTQMIKKERNASIGSTIERCFCTLALQKKDTMKKQSMKTFTIGTETSELKSIETANKSTKTKLKHSKNRPIELYECEPFTCIPGECDPNECLKRINIRNKVLKEVGSTITGRSRTISTSSGSTKPLKTVQVQYEPRYKERKVLAKTCKPEKYVEMKTKNYDVSKHPVSPKSRQAVKIGSTFSFDIEFYKNKLPTEKVKQMYFTKRKIKTGKKNYIRSMDKGIKMNKLNVAQVETQIQGPRKRDKSSVVGPLLKRCFCTLNLQKKWKHQNFKKESEKLRFQPPRVYTVNRAIVEDTHGIICNTRPTPVHNSFHRNFNRNQLNENSSVVQIVGNINAYKINNTWKPIKVKSMPQQCIETYDIHSQQCVKRLEKFVEETVDRSGFTKFPSLSSQIHETRLTSLTRFFRRSFYTMNIKVENGGNYEGPENRKSFKWKKHALHKLLPYECEPGICIPGECNPYECEKMIAKRFHKSPSKKSGTEYSSRSISSSANQSLSKSKQYKQQTMMNKSRKPLVYTEKSQVYKGTANNNQKQAVRIGSSFSFDIEFSKNLSTSHKNVVMPKCSSDTNLAKRIKRSSKSKGSGKIIKNLDSQSQSASVKTKHIASLAKPSTKRCFCTLKLQKKGRLHRKLKTEQPMISLSELNKEKTFSRGQNTEKIKPLKLTHALKSYECEPNICIPGQCDPHQCLERIKKRYYHEEEVGTSTILHELKSISTMSTDIQRKKIHKSRAVGVKPKKSLTIEKGGKKYPEYSNFKPLREAVRIGSSFSFDIEFFKDQSSHPLATHTYVGGESRKNKHSVEPSIKLTKHIDKSTQNNKKMIYQQSQFENIARHTSTLTNSVIKRCFCTAQLHKSKNTNDLLKSKRNGNSPSFIKRCFCVLNKINPTSNETKKDVKPKETQDKKINTRKIQDQRKLEPYECKPGICVPGECDPYICEKIMKKYRNENSQVATIDILKTRSISSNSANISKKNVKTLIRRKENLNNKNRSIKGQRKETATKNNMPNTTSWSPDKNLVRIGSKFSFDIEFFKEHPSTVIDNQKSITHKRKVVKDIGDKNQVKISSTKPFFPSYISQSSQVIKQKIKDRDIGINNLIKRCLCKLKLNKKYKYNHKSKIKEIDDQTDKMVKTKSAMPVEKKNLFRNTLLPYECEPDTCVPYQCDPYECEKRIKLRHKNQAKRQFGVSTSSPYKVSAYTITDTKKPTTKIQSIMTKKLHERVQAPYLYSGIGKVEKSKQSVRIGSAFNFNIEFFKDKIYDGFELQKLPKKNKDYNDRLKNQMRNKGKNTNQMNNGSRKMNTNQTQISKKLMDTNQTQLGYQVMRTQSTMTGFDPKKRCFCTLSLKKSKDKLSLPTKTLHASTETDDFKTSVHPISNLLFYECEPNVCIPGECDPVQCLEKIKKRHKTFGTGTKESQKKNVASSMKHRKDAKNKKVQIKQLHSPNSRKMLVQKTGNNKNRQAVRIGSNFSFDIEFFKTNNPNYNMDISELPKPLKSKHKLKNKTNNSDFEEKNLRSRALQSSSPEKTSHGSSMHPFLKRCFCTLKLQNAQANKIPITVDKHLGKLRQRHISTNSKDIATKKIPKMNNLSPCPCESFYCNCAPYEAAKKIGMRKKKHETQYTINQFHTLSHKGVGIKQDNMKFQKNRASFIDTDALVPKLNIDRPEIVEIPRFTNIFNKKAVRIGSNISFNIEFYKENFPYTNNNPKKCLVKHDYDKEVKRKGNKNSHHYIQNTNTIHLQNSRPEYNKIKTESKSVHAENILKRCFCTLKFQNNSSSKSHQNIMQPTIPFPQNFEVRRVAVQQNPKMLSKGTHIREKSVSTKINKKLLKRNKDINTPCNLYFCKNGASLLPDDMKTILPFMPEKFNRTVSKTMLPLENLKYNKPRESIIANHDKRLTRKRSQKNLHKKQPITQEKIASNKRFLGIKKFIAYCAKIFYPKSKSQNNENQARPHQLIYKSKPKKCDNQTCPYYLVKRLPPGISVKLNKKQIIKPKSFNNVSNTKQQIMSNCSKKLLHKKQNTKSESLDINCIPIDINCIPNQKRNKEEIKIIKGKDRALPLKVRFCDTAICKYKPQSDKMNEFPHSKNKRFASGAKSERLVQSSNYCYPCKVKITKEEYHKAAGDQLFKQKIECKKSPPKGNVEKIMSKIRETCCGKHAERPLLEMHVDSESFEILNRDELIHNVAKLNTKRKPRNEIHVNSIVHKILNKDKLCPCARCMCGPGTAKDSKIRKPSKKPCICGSSICAKKVQEVKTPIKRPKWKTCVCGSPVCDKQSAKLKALSHVENKCLCRQEMALRKTKLKAKNAKLNAKLKAKENKERAIRLKAYKQSDKMKRKKRTKKHKMLERRIDKKATDGVLFAESALDVGKMGITATIEMLRQTARCASNPKQAYQTLRTLEENPKLVAKFLQSAYHDTGVTATLRRVRLRCFAMRSMQRLRRKLESYPVIKYLLYIGSQKPKRRLSKRKKTKKKPQRERERFDFNCSLYMSSLRKKRFLSIYDRCPWFYQHFLSIVHVWKQFLDISLFLLAAVVWSPCILCMEICRACMCCFFCTG